MSNNTIAMPTKDAQGKDISTSIRDHGITIGKVYDANLGLRQAELPLGFSHNMKGNRHDVRDGNGQPVLSFFTVANGKSFISSIRPPR